MTITDKYIVETYTAMCNTLSNAIKKKLIEKLTASLVNKEDKTEQLFYETFGAFGSDQEPAEIYCEIKNARKFKSKEINL